MLVVVSGLLTGVLLTASGRWRFHVALCGREEVVPGPFFD